MALYMRSKFITISYGNLCYHHMKIKKPIVNFIIKNILIGNEYKTPTEFLTFTFCHDKMLFRLYFPVTIFTSETIILLLFLFCMYIETKNKEF